MTTIKMVSTAKTNNDVDKNVYGCQNRKIHVGENGVGRQNQQKLSTKAVLAVKTKRDCNNENAIGYRNEKSWRQIQMLSAVKTNKRREQKCFLLSNPPKKLAAKKS